MPGQLRQATHLLRIVRVLAYYNLDEYLTRITPLKPWLFLFHLFPRSKDNAPRGQRLREALEELGPVFVKLGQMLSTRPDLIPDDITSELSLLQDKVPPFPGDQALLILEQAYEEPVNHHIVDFNTVPLASASVAQVHDARLTDGTEVVVKIIRPGLEPRIKSDIDLLFMLARMGEKYSADIRRLHAVDVIDDYNKTIHDELDLMREAANASQLRHNFNNSPLLYVPEVYFDHTRTNVMVMEKIHGTTVSKIDTIVDKGIDLKQLSNNGVEIFYTQVFRDGFFHADMHPGNIFVLDDGRYAAVDFGIMGTLSDIDKHYLAENFLAFFQHDYRRVAQAHIDAGWVPEGTRVDEFESAIRSVCEPIFAKPLCEISFGRVLIRLFRVARRFNMEIQPQLVLLEKTLLYVEGLGRQLDPQLNLWDTAKPYLEQWARREYGPRAFFKEMRRQAPMWWKMGPRMPMLVHNVLEQASNGELKLTQPDQNLKKLQEETQKGQKRLFHAIVGSAMLISAALLAALDGYTPIMAGIAPLSSWVLGGLGALLLFISWPTSE
ncbi:MAG: ubiquinone biosynthesis regulatory protein kinase UbiB [Arenicellales bacterium]